MTLPGPSEAIMLKLQPMLSKFGFPCTIADLTRDDVPLIWANEGFEALTGYGRLELIGRNCRFLQGDAQCEVARQQVREALAAEIPTSAFFDNRRKDGTKFVNYLLIRPLGPNLPLVIGAQLDVTKLVESDRDKPGSYRFAEFANSGGTLAHMREAALSRWVTLLRSYLI